VFAVGFVVYLFATSSARHRVLHIALGMVLAGALGNLYDRAFIHADVIRFHDPHSGRAESFIGKIVGEPTANSVAVGGWPEGDDPRTFDRDEVEIRHQGVVRDFLKIVPRFPSWAPKAAAGRDVWPWVFNIADSSLVCGVVLLLFFSGRHHSHRSEECAA
jgi:lipoprotein signal peptidase